jgi:hypothetical protein
MLSTPLEKTPEPWYPIKGLSLAGLAALDAGKWSGKLVGLFENSFPAQLRTLSGKNLCHFPCCRVRQSRLGNGYEFLALYTTLSTVNLNPFKSPHTACLTCL